MRLAFDAVSLLSPLTGVGRYAYELASRLAADPRHVAGFFYATGWRPEVRAEPLPMARAMFSTVRQRIPRAYAISRWLQERNFSAGVRRHGFDLYHEQNHLAFAFDGPIVTTVHDLSWIRHPDAHPPERVRALERYFEPGLRRTNLVLTDSAFVKRELAEVFSMPADRVRVIPLGASAVFRPMTAPEASTVLERMDLAYGRYLLAVGTLEPRKNLPVALRAYARLPQVLQASCPLVVVGLKGWGPEALPRELGPLLRSGRIRLTGYLPSGDLAALTAGARALVYPSKYEGFGLPPLEAMACGVPTITSNAASIPEVVGDAGLMLPPEDEAGFCEAMRRMLEDSDLRDRLGLLALARSKSFSWDACYEATTRAYEDARRA